MSVSDYTHRRGPRARRIRRSPADGGGGAPHRPAEADRPRGGRHHHARRRSPSSSASSAFWSSSAPRRCRSSRPRGRPTWARCGWRARWRRARPAHAVLGVDESVRYVYDVTPSGTLTFFATDTGSAGVRSRAAVAPGRDHHDGIAIARPATSSRSGRPTGASRCSGSASCPSTRPACSRTSRWTLWSAAVIAVRCREATAAASLATSKTTTTSSSPVRSPTARSSSGGPIRPATGQGSRRAGGRPARKSRRCSVGRSGTVIAGTDARRRLPLGARRHADADRRRARAGPRRSRR